MKEKKLANRISEKIGPTEEQKERMLRGIVEGYRGEVPEAAGAGNGGRGAFRRLRPLLVAAVICVLITTTAFAAAYLGLDSRFLTFLKPSGEQEDFLAEGACSIDITIEDENGVLDIRQVIGDGNLTYILMDFTAPEGTVLDRDGYWFDGSSWFEDSYFHSTDYVLLEDGNKEDNKISLIMSIITRESLMGKRMHLNLGGLEAADDSGVLKTVLSGEWRASFDLDFKDYSTQYFLEEPVAMYGYEATIKKICVSPISVSVSVESPFTEEISQAADEANKRMGTGACRDSYPVTIHYEDGSSEKTAQFNKLEFASYMEHEILTVKTFETVINNKAIESIEFFGVKIPMKK